MTRLAVLVTAAAWAAAAAAQAPAYPYSIGDPTDEEQAFVERINRARAGAYAEGIRLANTTDPDVLAAMAFYGVDTLELLNQFAALDQELPPLSINPKLTQMARLHTQDMFTNTFSDTISVNPPPPFAPGDTPATRAAKIGYAADKQGENVFAYGRSVFYAHAAFEIQWGYYPYGMKSPPFERLNIHDADFHEIGVGVVLGSNGTSPRVGPLLVTQDLAKPANPLPFITGVAYYDLNGNGQYDPGEGLKGVSVQAWRNLVEGENGEPASGWSETATAGGYSIPFAEDGGYRVAFTGLGIMERATVVIAGGRNVKQDLKLAYSAPLLSGSPTPSIGYDNAYLITPVPGATRYEVRLFTENTAPWLEGAETGTTHVTITQSPGYTVIQGLVKASGTYAFQLAHPAGIAEEIVRINHLILPTTQSALQFASRLRNATADQSANVDVSVDGGQSWQNLYKQSGSGSPGEAGFTVRTLSLAAFAGKPLLVRFRYSFRGGSYAFGTDSTTGWFFDDISVTNSSRLQVLAQTSVVQPIYPLNPSSQQALLLQARPFNHARVLPHGPLLRVAPTTLAPLEAWRAQHFAPEDLADPAKEATVWGHDADPDGDGFNNLLEYALNGDPLSPAVGHMHPRVSHSDGVLKLHYIKFCNGLTFRTLVKDPRNGSGWSSAGVVQTPDPDTAPACTFIEAAVPFTGDPLFLRLEVTAP